MTDRFFFSNDSAMFKFQLVSWLICEAIPVTSDNNREPAIFIFINISFELYF